MIQINNNIIDISCGYFHNIILDKSSKAFGFGDNSYGQLGFDHSKESFNQNFIMNNIIQITTGSYNTLLLNNINEIYSFGSNSYGQLGLNLPISINISVSIPTQIIIQINNIIQISCGNYHCLLLSNAGLVYSFGLNNVINNK
jgi:alpha-tubulin suppressor-like RCC1 family protein